VLDVPDVPDHQGSGYPQGDVSDGDLLRTGRPSLMLKPAKTETTKPHSSWNGNRLAGELQ
jgi:hypothetical protein